MTKRAVLLTHFLINIFTGTNRLKSVTDEKDKTTSKTWDAEDEEYTYDASGNLSTTSETTEQFTANPIISSIVYDNRNLPLEITWHDGTKAVYRYNHAGQRIYKRVITSTSPKLSAAC